MKLEAKAIIPCKVCSGAGERNYKDAWVKCYKCRGKGRHLANVFDLHHEERNSLIVASALDHINYVANDRASDGDQVIFGRIETIVEATRRAIGGVI